MHSIQLAIWAVATLVVVALVFDFMNGFHDAANSIATVVSTGVLRPTTAVLFAAFFNLVGGMTQPIFDGGRILGNFENAKARQDELLQTYRKTVVQSFTDVDNALVAIRETTRRLQLQRDVLSSSRRAFDLAEQQLKAGTADIVTVLNTQLTLFQAEDAYSQAQLARLSAIVSLYQALGGGWEPKMERPVDAL